MKQNSNTELPIDEEVEVSPGFIVERRSFMAVFGGMSLAMLSGTIAKAAIEESSDKNISFDQFLAQANPLAQKLVGDTSISGQELYLRSIAALTSKLHNIPVPTKFNNTGQGKKAEDYKIGFVPGGDPFTVLHWRLEPGAICTPHVHEYGNVVSVGIEGAVRISNYVSTDKFDYEKNETFQIKKTVDQLLTAGSANLVPLNMIHGFQAGPDGARGLDITTRLLPKPERSTPYLSIANKATDEFTGIYDASWAYKS
ncbi:MAG: hypothetical protein HOH19_00775 [Kordiimonadaceae bacterium]|jgi:quercetin dioxygenase-like cupin family protein|nr:hypothetical protein [Kordiimonadaceae bacterium]MBT6031082.1 hypothetical protein [Kordiimonadaceae bacterium]